MWTDQPTGPYLGQYALREVLGKGGMGTVYRAYQEKLKREVAIKILPQDLASEPSYLDRFNREAEISASLEHPNIVPILDYGTQQGISFVVMRLLSGGTLQDRLRQRDTRPLPSVVELADMLKSLGSALDYAHSKMIIHRDLKPSNVMFDEHGTPYVVDFGIAKLIQSTSQLTKTGMAMGTPSYMPPEQWMSEHITPATDQYAMGILIYELLAGRPPYVADNPFALMKKHIEDQPTPVHQLNKDVPESISLVIEQAISKLPQDRYPTVSNFAEAFSAASVQTRSNTMATTGFFTYELHKPRASRGLNLETPMTLLPNTPTEITPPLQPTDKESVPTGKKKSRQIGLLLIPAVLALLLIVGVGFLLLQDENNTADNDDQNNIAAEATNTSTPQESAILPTDTPAQVAEGSDSGVSQENVNEIANDEVDSASNDSTQATNLLSNTTVLTTSDYDFAMQYDDFEVAPGGDYRRTHWVYDGDPDGCRYNSDGALFNDVFPDNDCALAINTDDIWLDHMGIFSADVQVPDNEQGLNANAGVLITAADNRWGAYCGVDTRVSDEVSVHFFVYSDGEHWVDTTTEFAPDTWVNLRLVYNLANKTFSCYADGQYIDTGIPTGDMEGMYNIPINLKLDTTATDRNQIAEAAFDNVDLVVYDFYDTFDQAGLDAELWSQDLVDNTGCEISGLPGLLRIINEATNDRQKCAILMTEPLPLEEPVAVAVEFKVNDDVTKPFNNTGMILINQERTWWTYCGFGNPTDDYVARFTMHNLDGSDIDYTIPAPIGDFVEFRMEIDPEIAKVACFANEELIGEAIAPDAETLRVQTFDMGLENYRGEGIDYIVGYADNVRIYPPSEQLFQFDGPSGPGGPDRDNDGPPDGPPPATSAPPTARPTSPPTLAPTTIPTLEPTIVPTLVPTIEPTATRRSGTGPTPTPDQDGGSSGPVATIVPTVTEILD